jgi:hypothetical protein
MLLLLGRLALRFLVFLHCSALFPGIPLYCFLLLLGGLPGLPAIFSNTGVFPLSMSWYRPCSTRGKQQNGSRNSLHNISGGKILQRFYTAAASTYGIAAEKPLLIFVGLYSATGSRALSKAQISGLGAGLRRYCLGGAEFRPFGLLRSLRAGSGLDGRGGRRHMSSGES